MGTKTGLNLQRCFNASGRLRIVAAINVTFGVYYYPIEQTDFFLFPLFEINRIKKMVLLQTFANVAYIA